jgi:hypothetical protein
MMLQWKNKGKTWEEIRIEWQRITGVLVGLSTLSVRYVKLRTNLSEHGTDVSISIFGHSPVYIRGYCDTQSLSGYWVWCFSSWPKYTTLKILLLILHDRI